MQNHFSVWSKQLGPGVREQFEGKLRFLDQILSDAASGTPVELRATALRHEMPPAALETALLALDCASVCRHSHPDDFEALCAVMKVAIKGQLPVDSAWLHRMLEFLAESDSIDPRTMPVAEVIGQVERFVAGQPAPDEWRPLLETIHQATAGSSQKTTKSLESLLARISRLGDESVVARFKADDGWAGTASQDLSLMSESQRKRWNAILSHASTVMPEPPAADWDIDPAEIQADSREADAYEREHNRRFFERNVSAVWTAASMKQVEAIGVEPFQVLRLKWLRVVPNSKPGTLSQFSLNREILRGLLYTCENSTDVDVAQALRSAAEYLYRNNSPLARVAVWVLARMPATTALHELTSLLHHVQAKTQVRLIDAGRELVAGRTGTPLSALGDLPLPTSGFTEIGKRVDCLSGFMAELAVTPSGAVDLRWLKPNGEEQKSIPAQVKRAHHEDVQHLKAAAKEVERTLSIARERLECAPLERRSWTCADWRQRYFDHPVVGTVARRIVWEFEHSGTTATAAFDGRSLVNQQGQPLNLSDLARVSVWHPLGSPVTEILQWRQRLAGSEVTQPFKQAHREVYLLSEAERATATYSNRFAAHILKQSQFRAFAKTRGWNAPYLGPWSGGDDDFAERVLPEWELRAELWLSGAGEEWADAGGFAYIATDQVRFCRMASRDPLPLDEVPPLVFSEVMRDVDLFVGVASVGNDPTWIDGGPDGRHADYWQRYAFGELSETAVTRRAALERIVPRLKIADRCTLGDRFLAVRGEKRTYRIHLGSGNILMEPDNKYLCIVPARSAKPDDSLFLPFEGDSRLSVILSKALLLADDLSITDPSIASQI
jgi:hypothetical protein